MQNDTAVDSSTPTTITGRSSCGPSESNTATTPSDDRLSRGFQDSDAYVAKREAHSGYNWSPHKYPDTIPELEAVRLQHNDEATPRNDGQSFHHAMRGTNTSSETGSSKGTDRPELMKSVRALERRFNRQPSESGSDNEREADQA